MKILKTCPECDRTFKVFPSRGSRKFCSHRCAATAHGQGYLMGGRNKGRVMSEEHKRKTVKNLVPGTAGKNRAPFSDEARRNMGISHKGVHSSFWRGGVNVINKPERERIRQSFEYKEWRRKVFERDGYACVECGATGYLEADHILSFAAYPALRFDINNGRTLCRACHMRTPTWGRPTDMHNTMLHSFTKLIHLLP